MVNIHRSPPAPRKPTLMHVLLRDGNDWSRKHMDSSLVDGAKL
jgi:hypothetical protein